MGEIIRKQNGRNKFYYIIFLVANLVLMVYYLSNTLIHFTTPRQFPVNSFLEFPLTLLIFPAEFFSFLFGLYFVYVLMEPKVNVVPKPLIGKKNKPVAILLPIYNEPKEIVENTVEACTKVRWPGGVKIYILDDSTEAVHKKEADSIAKKYKCAIVRREDRKGYKAGNINNAVKKIVKENYFVILDADQAPSPDFLEKTMDHFSDNEVGFVQTPQYFSNDNSPLERTAKIGANIFFQGMCTARSKDKAMVFCGTNAVIRTDVFRKVNGFSYYTATEDIDLGIRMNDKGYHGVYVPEILVVGEAPRDFKAYKSQQYRWANGNLAILRENWHKILAGKFTLRQQIHHFFVLGWWLIGLITMIYIAVPFISLFLGMPTHHTWLPNALVIWLYANVVLGVGMIYMSLKNRLTIDRITFRDAFLQYSLIVNSMFIYARAAINALFKRYAGFVRTSKKKSESGLRHIKWNLILAAVCFGASIYALYQGARSANIEQIRTFLPISAWLAFYAFILASSILFVGESRPDAVEDIVTVKNKEAVPA